jgi:hypothetical protein
LGVLWPEDLVEAKRAVVLGRPFSTHRGALGYEGFAALKVIVAALKERRAALGELGFTAPAAAEPLSGVVATRAFLVVFSELISDFFWIFTFLSSSRFFLFHN